MEAEGNENMSDEDDSGEGVERSKSEKGKDKRVINELEARLPFKHNIDFVA